MDIVQQYHYTISLASLCIRLQKIWKNGAKLFLKHSIQMKILCDLLIIQGLTFLIQYSRNLLIMTLTLVVYFRQSIVYRQKNAKKFG